MAKETVKIEGLREAQKALRELPNATAKNVLKRILVRRAQPLAAMMKSLAPVEYGDLRDSIVVTTRLSRSKRRRHKKFDPSDIEIFVGPGSNPQAKMQEFGTQHNPPHPFVRPTYDALKYTVTAGIKDDLWGEIKAAAERLARKSARAKSK